MYKLQELPRGLRMPHIAKHVPTRPDSFFGQKIEWSDHTPPVPVYIACFSTSKRKKLDESNAVLLFGARYHCGGAVLGGHLMPEAYLPEYFVARKGSGKRWKVSRLTQRLSDCYSSIDEEDDCKPARSIRSVESLSLRERPRWKSGAAQWPTHLARPMLFLGQAPVYQSELTRQLLAWDINLYLFWDPEADLFKLITQEMSLQTEDDHALRRKVRKIT